MSFSILPSVGDRVVVHGKHSGTVRFVGSVDYANGDDWCGIEMDESGIGKNNGTVKGKTYFSTAPKMALLVRATAVQSEADAKTKKKSTSSRSSAPRSRNAPRSSAPRSGGSGGSGEDE